MSKKSNRHHSSRIRKQRKTLDKVDQEVVVLRRKNQCNCPHTGDHGIDVSINNRQQNGKEDTTFTCRICGKEMRLNGIPLKDLAKSIATLDCAMDAVKINLNMAREKDVKIADLISDAQIVINYKIMKLYESINRPDNNRRSHNDPDMDCYGNAGFPRRNR